METGDHSRVDEGLLARLREPGGPVESGGAMVTNFRSGLRGILAMQWNRRCILNLIGGVPLAKPSWRVSRLRPWGFWFEFWTPMWHDGRGPYLSLGLGPIAVYRGY